MAGFRGTSQRQKGTIMAHIDMDTYLGSIETVDSAIMVLTNGTTITGTLVMAHGPAGGNPVIRWTGSETELLAFIAQTYYLNDLDEYEMYEALVVQ